MTCLLIFSNNQPANIKLFTCANGAKKTPRNNLSGWNRTGDTIVSYDNHLDMRPKERTRMLVI